MFILRVPGYDFSFSDHEAVEVGLDVEEEEKEEEGHHKKDEKGHEVENAKYQLDQRDQDDLRELVTEALIKTRKSQAFLLLLPLVFLLPIGVICLFATSSLPPWLIISLVFLSTSASCFTVMLAVITFQQRIVAFSDVIGRLNC